jgi:hypothetical protein
MRRACGLSVILLAAFLGPARLAAQDSPTIPAGTVLNTRLTTLLSTKTSETGDPFTARIADPIFSGGVEIVPAGSMVAGHVAFVKPPGRVKAKAEMRLVADKITTPEGEVFDLTAALEDAQGANGGKVKGDEGAIQGAGKSTKDTAINTGVTAGVGAGVGAIAGGGKGSLYGLGAGAVVGLIRGLHKKHPDVLLMTGTELTFVVQRNTVGKKGSLPGTTSE